MTHVGRGLDEWDAALAPSEPVPLVASDQQVVKALAVLKTLLAAGLHPEFHFDIDESKGLWGARLAPYPLDVCLEAVRLWIEAPGKDMPSVGDMENICAQVKRQWDLEATEDAAAANTKVCVNCGGDRWVREDDENTTAVPSKERDPDTGELVDVVLEVRGHHRRPCPACPEMRAYSDLWDAGHFTPEHCARGGCADCRDYQRPFHEVDRGRRHRR